MSPTRCTSAPGPSVKRIRFFILYPPLPVLGRGFLLHLDVTQVARSWFIPLGAASSCLPQRSATGLVFHKQIPLNQA